MHIISLKEALQDTAPWDTSTCPRPFTSWPTTSILGKLPGLLQSLSSSITRIVVHVGSNDLAWGATELTKSAFNSLFDFLRTCGKSVFISGPIPTLGRGDARFSRLLLLNTWLKPAWVFTSWTILISFGIHRLSLSPMAFTQPPLEVACPQPIFSTLYILLHVIDYLHHTPPLQPLFFTPCKQQHRAHLTIAPVRPNQLLTLPLFPRLSPYSPSYHTDHLALYI